MTKKILLATSRGTCRETAMLSWLEKYESCLRAVEFALVLFVIGLIGWFVIVAAYATLLNWLLFAILTPVAAFLIFLFSSKLCLQDVALEIDAAVRGLEYQIIKAPCQCPTEPPACERKLTLSAFIKEF